MKNNLSILTELDSSELFLTEFEIRDIVKKRLILEEIFRSPIHDLILEQGTGTDSIDAAFEQLSLNLDDAERARAYANIFSVIGGATTTAAIMAIPLIPMSWKLMACGVLGASVAVVNEIVKEFVSESILKEDVKGLFSANNMGQNSKAIRMAKGLANGITSGRIKMAELPPAPGGVRDALGLPPSGDINPAEYAEHLNTFADRLSTPAPDFLGVGTGNFTERTYKSSGIPYWDALCGDSDYEQQAEEIWKAFEDNLSASNNSGQELMILKVKEVLNRGFAAHELVYIDWELGKILQEGAGTSSPRATFDGEGWTNDYFTCTRDVYNTHRGDADFSNLFFIVQYCDSLNNQVSSVTGYSDGDVAQLIESQWGGSFLKELSTQRTICIQDDIAARPTQLEAYTLGRPTGISSVFPEHGLRNGGVTFIGRGFFGALLPTKWEQFKYYIEQAYNWLRQAINSAAAWTGAALTQLGAWLSTNIPLMIAAVGAGLTSFGNAVAQFFTDFWQWLTGLFNSAPTPGTTPSSGTSRTSASRGGGGRYRPEVEEMQRIMNKINREKSLGGSDIAVDGYWGSETDGMWELVTNYGFADGILKDDPDAGTYSSNFHSWNPMSAKLRDNQGTIYPGYSSDAQGALNIIKDIDNGNTDYGLGGDDGQTRDPIIKSEEEETQEPPEDLSTPKPTRGGVGVRGIKVRVDAGNNQYKTFESLGFPEGTTRNVTEDILASIRDENFTGTGEEGIQLKVPITRRGKVSNVRWVVIGKTSNFLETFPYFNSLAGKIRDTLKSTPPIPELRDRVSSFRGKAFTISITVPPGAKRQR